MINEFYIPDSAQIRTQKGKPGSYVFEPMDGVDAEVISDMIHDAGVEAWGTYEELLYRGVAKEVARMVLPVNIYTQFYII